MKSEFHTTTKSVAEPRRSSKALSKAKLAWEKGHGHSLVVCCWVSSTTAFWIRLKPLHLRSMLSKSVRYTDNCKACSWHQSTERVQFFSTTAPDDMSHNQRFKSWTNWAKKFCIIHHIHLTFRQATATSSSISTTFFRENTSTTSRTQKMLSETASNPKAQIFMLQE